MNVASRTIEFRSIGCTFYGKSGTTAAIDDVSFTVAPDAFTSIVGPSGCGKSTLLKIASGLVRPTSGETMLRGQPVTTIRQDVGFVTQDSNLFPWLTTRQNIEFALRVRGLDRQQKRARADEYLKMVGLDGFESSYPPQLSGGMQKRASIARTLVYDPDVLLMDEPFGALDAQTKMKLQEQLLTIWQGRPKTVLFVTHDISEAVALSDWVVVMSARPGRIKKIVKVDLPRPRDVYEMHSQEGFSEVYGEIWSALKDEVQV